MPPLRIEEDDGISVLSLTIDDTTATFRDESGRPMWAGGRGAGKQGDRNVGGENGQKAADDRSEESRGRGGGRNAGAAASAI